SGSSPPATSTARPPLWAGCMRANPCSVTSPADCGWCWPATTWARCSRRPRSRPASCAAWKQPGSAAPARKSTKGAERAHMQAWLTRRGERFYEWMNAWGRVLAFTGVAVKGALTPSTYNKATRLVVQKQIYFTAWQILPGFALFSAVFSVLIIEIVGRNASAYGLYAYALELVVRVLVLEILPLVTALFVALRTGAAINTEVA